MDANNIRTADDLIRFLTVDKPKQHESTSEETTQEQNVTEKPKRKLLINNLDKMIDNGLNILLVGLHGTGKTQSILDVCEDHEWSLKSFSCATLDPYTELVGVPVPEDDTEHGGKKLHMIRPRDVDDAEVVFFDELNRARPEVQNAVLEIINNRTINGEPLPNLKCCIAAINPPDGKYKATELDPALMDRFDVYYNMKPRVDANYMKDFIPEKTAQILVKWWGAIDQKKRENYISPRRLMKIGQVFTALGDKKSFKAAFPPGSRVDSEKLWQMLTAQDGDVVSTDGVKTSNFFQFELNAFNLKKKKALIINELVNNPNAVDMHNDVADALMNVQLSPKKLCDDYWQIVEAMRLPSIEKIMNRKSNSWKSQIRNYYSAQRGQNGEQWAEDRKRIHAAINSVTVHHSSKLTPLASQQNNNSKP